jgi:very-short-patch-repair endonuclease
MGRYIVDFVCLERRLVIEVDGSQHVAHASQDKQRDAWLRFSGFRVLRFWDNQVLNEIDVVKEILDRTLEAGERPPS